MIVETNRGWNDRNRYQMVSLGVVFNGNKYKDM
jgi:hypothetical protein